MADQRDPASHVWDLLYVAGLVPELDALQVLPRRAKKRVPAIDKSIEAPERTRKALEGILESVRSGPALLDPVQQHVNAELKLGMDAKGVPLLHGNEIAKAVMALVDIQAKGEVQVDPKKVRELARLTANSPTLAEVVPPPGPGVPDTGDGDPGAAVELSDRQLKKAVATYERRSDAAEKIVAKALEHGAKPNVTNGALAFDAARKESGAAEISHFRGTKLDEVREEVLDGCNNLTVIMPDGREAARIFTRYTTDDPVSSFIWPANPPNWPAANQYTLFRGMKASDSTKLKGLRDPLHKGYTANFVEKVMITGEVETELAIRFFVEGAKSNKFEGKTKEDLINENPNATVVGMTFDLARNGGGDGNIDVDFGYLHVQRMPNGRTEVKAQKTVRFTRSDNAPSGYACLLGWLNSVRAMNSVQPQE